MFQRCVFDGHYNRVLNDSRDRTGSWHFLYRPTDRITSGMCVGRLHLLSHEAGLILKNLGRGGVKMYCCSYGWKRGRERGARCLTEE